ncbi:MAG: hypothetical protein ABSH36_12055 [Solirubrobacteraceae bacterium]
MIQQRRLSSSQVVGYCARETAALDLLGNEILQHCVAGKTPSQNDSNPGLRPCGAPCLCDSSCRESVIPLRSLPDALEHVTHDSGDRRAYTLFVGRVAAAGVRYGFLDASLYRVNYLWVAELEPISNLGANLVE